jgi:hypothetical protein
VKLTPHYVPFIKSAPPKALRAHGLGAVMTVGACTGTAPARTAETAPPLEGGAHCSQSVMRSYSLSAVVKRGMPVKVTCDGPARVQVIFDFYAMTPQSRDLAHIVHFLTLREDGFFWSEGSLNRHTYLVRTARR